MSTSVQVGIQCVQSPSNILQELWKTVKECFFVPHTDRAHTS